MFFGGIPRALARTRSARTPGKPITSTLTTPTVTSPWRKTIARTLSSPRLSCTRDPAAHSSRNRQERIGRRDANARPHFNFSLCGRDGDEQATQHGRRHQQSETERSNHGSPRFEMFCTSVGTAAALARLSKPGLWYTTIHTTKGTARIPGSASAKRRFSRRASRQLTMASSRHDFAQNPAEIPSSTPASETRLGTSMFRRCTGIVMRRSATVMPRVNSPATSTSIAIRRLSKRSSRVTARYRHDLSQRDSFPPHFFVVGPEGVGQQIFEEPPAAGRLVESQALDVFHRQHGLAADFQRNQCLGGRHSTTVRAASGSQ